MKTKQILTAGAIALSMILTGCSASSTGTKDTKTTEVAKKKEVKTIGQKNADLIRNQISELQQSNQENNISKSKEILHFIKEVFVNASGSLIAAGVIQAIQSLV